MLIEKKGRHVGHAAYHKRAAQDQHAGLKYKRDRITVTDSDINAPTVLPEVVIYVDQNGNTVRTATETVVHMPASHAPLPEATVTSTPSPTSTPTPTVAPAATQAPPPVQASAATPSESSTSKESTPEVSTATSAASTPSTPSAVATEPVPTPAPSTPAAEPNPQPEPAPEPEPTPQPLLPGLVPSLPIPLPLSPDPSPSPAPAPAPATERDLHGITYSPYKRGGGCKTPEEVDADYSIFAKEHGVVRLYGVDCDQVATSYAAAKKYGNKLFLGLFDIKDVDSAIQAMNEGLQGDWSMVDTVSVGNELVNNGQASVAEVMSAMTTARVALKSFGYEGPLVTVDTFVAVLSNPQLCQISDYCAVNVHPFFDGNVGADQAGKFVTDMVAHLRSTIGYDGRVRVTETGWPWKGLPNRAAVPGLPEQASALASIKSAYSTTPQDVVLFTAFNDPWKTEDAATFMAEPYWGQDGRYSPCDQK